MTMLVWRPCRRDGRRLHGRRGLKYQRCSRTRSQSKSPPSRAAWIEIASSAFFSCSAWSPPSLAAWIEIFPASLQSGCCTSPPSRAAWIEIGKTWISLVKWASPPSRAAWIEISMKTTPTRAQRSPPSRAAWIEIDAEIQPLCDAIGRRLHGRRGLKSRFARKNITFRSRRLHGRRGLKWSAPCRSPCARWSPPSRAAWIEIV